VSMNGVSMILVPVLLLLGCPHPGAVQSMRFDSAVADAIPICEQFFFPNSMARSPGFDINAHQAELEHRILGLAASFRSDAGLSYLEERVGRETDDAAKACITKLLDHARSAV